MAKLMRIYPEQFGKEMADELTKHNEFNGNSMNNDRERDERASPAKVRIRKFQYNRKT